VSTPANLGTKFFVKHTTFSSFFTEKPFDAICCHSLPSDPIQVHAIANDMSKCVARTGNGTWIVLVYYIGLTVLVCNV